MSRPLTLTALLVGDYDEAIGFYVEKLGFTLTTDTGQGGGKCWVLVTPLSRIHTNPPIAR